jgi:hypothetical protein
MPTKLRICFLLNAQLHQVMHAMPTAVRLARKSGTEVHVLSPHRENIAIARRITDSLGGAPIRFIHHRPKIAGLVGGISGGSIGTKKLMLYALRQMLEGYDAIAVPERTSLALRQMGLARPVFIQLDHGAGDGAFGYERRIRNFDFVLVAGVKQRERMIRTDLIRQGHFSVVGYPKFEAADALRDSVWNPFGGDRPVVLYTPHYGAQSSWEKCGIQVLQAFADQDEFDLVFAPHIRLFESPEMRRAWGPRIATLAASDRIFVDLGSDRSVDMTYTELADIYLGDVSSQVYEFLRRPRPCVFLNPHNLDWRSDENYGHWRLGLVVDSARGIVDAVRSARATHATYRLVQERAFARTFDRRAEPPSERAARAIAKYLRREVPSRRVRLERPPDIPKFAAQAACALVLVALGWGIHGQRAAPLIQQPTLAMAADESRDEFAALAPASRRSVEPYRQLARDNGLPSPAIPAGWQVISSAVLTTGMGRVLEVSALTEDGIPVAVVASGSATQPKQAPIIRKGDDEWTASWGAGKSAYAAAAQTSPREMKLLVGELIGPKSV